MINTTSIKIFFFYKFLSIALCQAMENDKQDKFLTFPTKEITQPSKRITISEEDFDFPNIDTLRSQRREATVTPPSSPLIKKMPELINAEETHRKEKRFGMRLESIPILANIEEKGQLTKLSLRYSEKKLAEREKRK